MLQGAQPYTGAKMQNFLTRTSAPPYTGTVQATPSAPTTPITSPIHPDSGARTHPKTAVSAADVCYEVREGQSISLHDAECHPFLTLSGCYSGLIQPCDESQGS